MGQIRNECRIFAGKYEGGKPFGKPSPRLHEKQILKSILDK
jgi:hypothetical protein